MSKVVTRWVWCSLGAVVSGAIAVTVAAFGFRPVFLAAVNSCFWVLNGFGALFMLVWIIGGFANRKQVYWDWMLVAAVGLVASLVGMQFSSRWKLILATCLLLVFVLLFMSNALAEESRWEEVQFNPNMVWLGLGLLSVLTFVAFHHYHGYWYAVLTTTVLTCVYFHNREKA